MVDNCNPRLHSMCDVRLWTPQHVTLPSHLYAPCEVVHGLAGTYKYNATINLEIFAGGCHTGF